MKKIKLISSLLLCSILCNPFVLKAAVKPGESFTASANCGVYEGSVSVSASNATITSAGNWCERGKSVSATAVAGSVGTASVSFILVDGSDNSTDTPVAVENLNLGGTSVNVEAPVVEQKPTTTPSTSNTNKNNLNQNTTNQQSNQQTTNQQVESKPVKEPEEDTKSKDTSLKSLSITGYELSPKFSASTTSYKVNLPAETTSIEVKASVNDSKASVTGTGNIKVQAGENEINVVVTSEYGTKQTYTIKAYVDEKPLIYTNYNEQKLGVVRNINGVEVPEGFKKTSVKLEGKEIAAWKNEKLNKTIVYLSDEKESRSFYLFADGKVKTKITYKELLGRKFFLVDIPKDKQNMEGMVYGEVTVDKTKLKGWTFRDKTFENFVLIYVMGMDGEMHYYQYEKTENILQLYSGSASVTQETYVKQTNSLKNSQTQRTVWMYVAIASWVVVVAGVVAFFIWKKRNEIRS